jgi:hypothetical protein
MSKGSIDYWNEGWSAGWAAGRQDPLESPISGTITRMEHGAWEFAVFESDGDEFASGTAPTLDGAMDMMREYLHAEYGKKEGDQR